LDNARQRGEQLLQGLAQLRAEHPQIAEVRGLGLMIGLELRDDAGRPDKALAKRIVEACRQNHLLLLTCGPWENTIRFIPPLIVSREQIREALDVFAAAVRGSLIGEGTSASSRTKAT
jgi:4-aminobutyrate aminotransferase